MNFKRFHESKNLFDESTITYGKWTNSAGSVQDYAYGARTVDIGASVITIKIYEVLPYSFSVCWLDSNKGFIERWHEANPSSSNSYTLNPPQNAEYFYLQVANGTDASNPITAEQIASYQIMLNTGSQPLPYEPYSSEVWHNIPYYIHNTSTDTITTPADIYANDTTATVGLKGNMEQASGVSPTTPIQPSECGERTGNLFDKNATNVNNGYISNGYLRSDGSINTNTDYRASEYIRISQNQQYTLRYGASLNNPSVCFYDSAKNYISGIAYANRWDVPFTTPQNAEYLRLSFRAVDPSSVILNLGSSALPYEPYGYKIPILTNSTTTPVYLGEVQSTRRIKKFVLDGTGGSITASGRYRITVSDKINVVPICTHYKGSNVTSYTELNDGEVTMGISSYLTIYDSNCTTIDEYQAYLQQQYTAGTPVTVWYVLATFTTGIVNEPLRKIGEYADEVSGITIPTIAGANTISVDTTLQPSEVTVNYKGWHPVADVHEAENGQWD